MAEVDGRGATLRYVVWAEPRQRALRNSATDAVKGLVETADRGGRPGRLHVLG